MEKIQCPKCGKIYDENFCGNCGKQLKKDGQALWQKCPICGNIESAKFVEKGICEKKLEKLRDEVKKYEDKKEKEWFGRLYFLTNFVCKSIILVILLVVSLLISVYLQLGKYISVNFNPGTDNAIFTLLIFLPSLIFIIFTLILAFRGISVRNKAKQEFLLNYPKFKELI